MYLSTKSVDNKKLLINFDNITFVKELDNEICRIYTSDGNSLDVKLDIDAARQYLGVSI